MKTIAALLADHSANLPAIGAPGRDWLSYEGLAAQAAHVADALHRAGVGRGDRVAIVLLGRG